MSAKVSVIIPVYGVEKYIERCARSLFEQTLDDIEYLFIDDCSTDGSIDVLNRVLEEYPQRKPQVTIHCMDKNSGQAAVREWGVLNATGEYLIHCDSDDWVEPDMYRLLYEKAISDKADVVVCDYNISDGVQLLRTVIGCGNTGKNEFIGRLLSLQDAWSLWNKLFRRDICVNNIIYPQNNMGEDMVLVLQYILKVKTISYVKAPLYNYFCNTSSITHEVSEEAKKRNISGNIENTNIIISLFKKNNLARQYSQELNLLQWRVKVLLWGIDMHSTSYEIWHSTFKGSGFGFLRNNHIRFSDKIRYLLTCIHIYPFKRKGAE